MKDLSIFQLTKVIRQFFTENDFTEISVPPMVENPGMETHIHPFAITSKKDNSEIGYLHTSPEFFMKKALTKELDNIFTLSFSFRDEPKSEIHRNQFLMLEWYRKNKTYNEILDDSKNLIEFCAKKINKEANSTFRAFQVKTIEEVFIDILNFSILDYLDFDSLAQYTKTNLKHLPLAQDLSSWQWDDLFFLIFLNDIEPKLKKMGNIILKDYPAPLAALSTIKKEDPRVCERFEIYMDGIEIANCFNELTGLDELRTRFQNQNQLKKQLYNYKLPEPQKFYTTMGNYPPSAGIALGVERLFQVLTQYSSNEFITDLTSQDD